MSDHEKSQSDSNASHAQGHDADAHKHKKHKHHHGGHGAHEEHEEGWIVSFADNVLLQMGFFVILLALNMGPKGGGEGEGPDGGAAAQNNSFIDAAIIIRDAFNSPVRMDSTDPNDAPLIRRIREKQGQAKDGVPSDRRETDNPQSVRPSDLSSFGGYVEFEAASDKLSDAARERLDAIAAKLLGSRNMIEIRGHASALETQRDAKIARELAYARSWTVGEALVHLGLDWRQIRLVSAGEVDPALPRARTKDDARTNQRVEIVRLDEVMPPDEFGGQ